jgi:acetyl-CoA/propionyl-CoA carboxylase biotin carboxyl carrier protein
MRALAPLLIANRGEIAVRIARSARALGLETVGAFSGEDADAVHVGVLDAAVRIDSYLDPAELVRAARLTGARAVHPGYGFLSENAGFARAVLDAGLTWVGPPPEAIELMGDKQAAKRAAARAGVPVVPEGDSSQLPVVVKAVAGGGGKGMRLVRRAEELEEAIAAAQREALAAFGDQRVMLERWIERPRHIEVQVLADAHGAVLHVGERECTLQRRHQKVVEEAPSPVIDAARREEMGAAAVALARAAGYVSAGTVEFVTTADASEFFFLEMNTRLQVEHPVTELVYGLDLVELQLRIAAGEPLPFAQERLRPRGHAVEARLYAEDPAGGFLPATGTIVRYREPAGTGVRVDSGVREGTVVGTQFDPLLAKVIAHGADREQAMQRLDRALAEFELLGVATNAAHLRALLAREDVRAGEQDTGLLERTLPELAGPPPEDLLVAGALALAGSSRPAGPWRRRFDAGEVRIAEGRADLAAEGRTNPGRSWAAEVRELGDGRFLVELDGIARRYAVHAAEEVLWVGRDGHQLETRALRSRAADAAPSPDSLEAPMPGTVVQVRCGEGERVKAGDVLLVLESMKMELQVTAPHAGVVSGLSLRPGDRVARRQRLVEVIAEGDGWQGGNGP